MTRRDQCFFIGKRACLLPPEEAVHAWRALSESVYAMGEMDMPKFKHLLLAIRNATIKARARERQRTS